VCTKAGKVWVVGLESDCVCGIVCVQTTNTNTTWPLFLSRTEFKRPVIELWITDPTCKFRGPHCFRLKDPIKETQSDVYGIGRSVFSTTLGSGLIQ